MIADRGLAGGSKFRYIIEEHDRLRRVKEAQEKLLSEYQYNKKAEREIQTDPMNTKSMIPNGMKWVATRTGYAKQPCRL